MEKQLKSRRRRMGIWAVLLLAIPVLTGCAQNYNSPIGDCSPNYTVNDPHGRFSIQQAGTNRSVQWGIYPNADIGARARNYLFDVYVGSKKVDHKDQSYAPHGSISEVDIDGKSGQIAKITGTVNDGENNILYLTIQCYLA